MKKETASSNHEYTGFVTLSTARSPGTLIPSSDSYSTKCNNPTVNRQWTNHAVLQLVVTMSVGSGVDYGRVLLRRVTDFKG